MDAATMGGATDTLITRAVEWAKAQGIYKPGRIAVMHGSTAADVDNSAMIKIVDV